MKKTFKLSVEGKNPERLLEATKHEIRQYMARERRKARPDGVDYWDFDCKFGADLQSATSVHSSRVTALIDAAAQTGAPAFYLELLAKPGVRKARPKPDSTALN